MMAKEWISREEAYQSLPQDELISYNLKRIARAGQEMRDFLVNLKHGENITGEEALNISNYYGIKPEDVVFMMMMRGVLIDVLEYSDLLKKQRERHKNAKLCTNID